jgi:hypothetical protein
MNTDWSFGMHKCSETKERLIEMVLDGVDGAVELDGCAECQTEFAALNATLRMTRRLNHAGPDESYWAGYHARLRQKIMMSEESSHAKAQRREEDAKKNRASDLRLFFAPLRLCVRIPVPLVALTILAFAALGVFAVRAARRPPVQTSVIVHVPVEVPVVQEKIVTRVVYRERTFARSRKPPTEETPTSLAGFKPTEDVKLVVIKGGAPYEK